MTEQQKAKANALLSKLNFDECLKTFNGIEAGNPMRSLIMDHMEALDPDRFDEWLDS